QGQDMGGHLREVTLSRGRPGRGAPGGWRRRRPFRRGRSGADAAGMRTRRSSLTLVTAILAAVLVALPWTRTTAVAAGRPAAADRLTPVTRITPVTGCHDL